MKIHTNLPENIRGIKYYKNSHYIELEDVEGRIHKVVATDLLRGRCKDRMGLGKATALFYS